MQRFVVIGLILPRFSSDWQAVTDHTVNTFLLQSKCSINPMFWAKRLL